MQLIEQLRKGQGAPVHMIDELSKAMPEMLWLTELKQDGGDLTLDGRCTTLTALSDFVGNLERIGYFAAPSRFSTARSKPAAAPAAELIKFTLKATFAMPGSEPELPAAGRTATPLEHDGGAR